MHALLKPAPKTQLGAEALMRRRFTYSFLLSFLLFFFNILRLLSPPFLAMPSLCLRARSPGNAPARPTNVPLKDAQSPPLKKKKSFNDDNCFRVSTHCTTIKQTMENPSLLRKSVFYSNRLVRDVSASQR